MASLTGQLVAETYKALLKLIDNDILTASEKQITDGFGGGSNVFIDSQGFLRANKYKVTNGLATQFLKADGSLDANSYLTSITGAQVITALGYTPVPTTRTITINGETHNLAADNTWTIGGTAAIWGNITGTLSNQTDLQNALNAKFDDPTGNTTQYIDGTGALQTFPTMLSSDNLIKLVRNQSGGTMTAGTIVYINGATGNKPTIAKALATSDATSAQTYGMVQANIANNADGYIVVIGNVNDLDTHSLTEGAQLYLSATTAGAWTTTKQYAPNHLVYVGIVLRSHPTQGIIGVKIQNGYELDELHDVSAQSPTNNDGIFFEASTSLWKNKSIATVLGYTPQAQLSGTGFVKASGTTISYDNSTYLTTADAASTYQTLANLSTDLATSATKYPSVNAVIAGLATKQPLDADLTAIAGLTGTSGFLIKTAADTWSLDTNTYLTTATAASTYQRLDKMVSNLLASDTEYPNSNAVIAALALKANAANPVFTGNMTISGAEPKLYFTDTDNNPDYTVFIDSGIFYIYDQTAGATRFSIGSTGNISTGTGKSITAGSFVKESGTATQFLKADGSIDSSTYVTSASLANYLLITTAASTYQRLDKMVSNLLASDTEYPNSNAVLAKLALKADAANPVFTGNMTISGAEPKLYFVDTDQNPDYTVFIDSGYFYIYDQTAGATRFSINSSGNISTGVGKSITAGSFIKDGGTASQYLMADGSATTLSGLVTGSGTLGYHTKWTGSSTVGNGIIYDNGTKIGINTNDPKDALDVNGSIRFRANTPDFTAFLDSAVIDYVPTSVFTNDPTIRIAAVGTATIGAGIRFFTGTSTGLSEKGRFFPNGNFFIGSSATDSGYKLDVNGTGRFIGAVTLSSNLTVNGLYYVPNSSYFISGSNGYRFNSSNDLYNNFIVYDNGSTYTRGAGNFSSTISATGTIFANNIASNIRLKGGNTDALDGFVGANTDGTLYFRNWAGTYGVAFAPTSGNASFTGSIQSGGSVIIGSGGIYQTGSIYSDGSWGMIFRAKQASPTNAEYRWARSDDSDLMRISPSGGLEVGFTATIGSYKLDVAGQIRAVSGSPLIVSMSTTASNDAVVAARWQGGTGTEMRYFPNEALAYFDNTYQATSGQVFGDIRFRVNSGGTMTPVMTVKANNTSVGINTITPGQKLEVVGAIKTSSNSSDFSQQGFQIDYYNGGSVARLAAFKSTGVDMSFSTTANGEGGPSEKLRIYGAGNALFASYVTATAFYESSDIRLKTLIESNPIIKGIEKLEAKLYEKDGKIELGYFAQDAEMIMPYAVTKNADGFLNLSYREVHTAKIARLEQRVAELEKQLNVA